MIPFNKNYNNHILNKVILKIGINSTVKIKAYKCEKCMLYFWYDSLGTYLHIKENGESNGYAKLTCDEIIIKNIIE